MICDRSALFSRGFSSYTRSNPTTCRAHSPFRNACKTRSTIKTRCDGALHHTQRNNQIKSKIKHSLTHVELPEQTSMNARLKSNPSFNDLLPSLLYINKNHYQLYKNSSLYDEIINLFKTEYMPLIYKYENELTLELKLALVKSIKWLKAEPQYDGLINRLLAEIKQYCLDCYYGNETACHTESKPLSIKSLIQLMKIFYDIGDFNLNTSYLVLFSDALMAECDKLSTFELVIVLKYLTFISANTEARSSKALIEKAEKTATQLLHYLMKTRTADFDLHTKAAINLSSVYFYNHPFVELNYSNFGGCPSKAEKIVLDSLTKQGFRHGQDFKTETCYRGISPIDFLFPDYKLVVELNGPSHFMGANMLAKNGHTIIRNKILNRAGYRMYNIDYSEKMATSLYHSFLEEAAFDLGNYLNSIKK